MKRVKIILDNPNLSKLKAGDICEFAFNFGENRFCKLLDSNGKAWYIQDDFFEVLVDNNK